MKILVLTGIRRIKMIDRLQPEDRNPDDVLIRIKTVGVRGKLNRTFRFEGTQNQAKWSYFLYRTFGIPACKSICIRCQLLHKPIRN